MIIKLIGGIPTHWTNNVGTFSRSHLFSQNLWRLRIFNDLKYQPNIGVGVIELPNYISFNGPLVRSGACPETHEPMDLHLPCSGWSRVAEGTIVDVLVDVGGAGVIEGGTCVDVDVGTGVDVDMAVGAAAGRQATSAMESRSDEVMERALIAVVLLSDGIINWRKCLQNQYGMDFVVSDCD